MVARTPPKQRRALAPLNPVLLRETVKKVDKCMARLQELQYTVTGEQKVISGVSLSPRSTRGYIRTSLRCKQESLRIKNAANPRKSPGGKLPAATATGEWRRMSLPAMLLGETVGEILQASQFARQIVATVSSRTTKRTTLEDPKTPVTDQRKHKSPLENTELKSKRKKEKQNKLQASRSEVDLSPSYRRARSRINFKVSPPKKRESPKENAHYVANRVSPRNRPWVKKTVLFPNPLFLSANTNATTQQQKFCRTRSPVIPKSKQTTTLHKFLIKSPPSGLKFHVKIKNAPVLSVSRSPTRENLPKKSSPKESTASKLRRSFSPSRLTNRLVSPLKSRKSVQKKDVFMSGLKQHLTATPRRFSLGRI